MSIAALLVSLAGPSAFVLLSDRIFGERPNLSIQVLLQVAYCGLAAFVMFVVVRVERQPLKSIGLGRPGWSTIVSAGMLAAGLYLLSMLTAPLASLIGPAAVDAGIARLAEMPLWFRVVLGATGGMVEETLYRGYAVERLSTLTGRRWLGASLAAIAFGLAHISPWGLGFALIADLPFGIVMTLFYLWRRDLWANILVHSGGLVMSLVSLS